MRRLLLAHDGQRGDAGGKHNNELAKEKSMRWIGEGGVACRCGRVQVKKHPQGYPRGSDQARAYTTMTRSQTIRSDREKIRYECEIVWGMEVPVDATAGYRGRP